VDWPAEFKYLTTRHSRPSHDDLVASLGPAFDSHQADALASILVVMFDRIAELERQF
jgi:hypothetical protein